MHTPSAREPTGLQVAFLVFAVVLLATPFHRHVGPWLGIPPAGPIVDRLFIFVPAAAILVLVPALRRYCVERLREPIHAGGYTEVGLVATAKILMPFAVFGAVVAWRWLMGGEMAVARLVGDQPSPSAQLAASLTIESIAYAIVFAGVVGPIIEELVFRGLLYDAWERQWGWFWSMLATSAVFAAYHPIPLAAFVSSIVFVLVMRRTGSIRSAIVVHAAGNTALWYPLMGQFYLDPKGKETGEIHLWAFHLAMLALFALAIPLYAWMARDRQAPEDPVEAETLVLR